MKLTAHWPNDLEMPKVVHNVQFTMTNVQSVLLIGQSVVEFIEVFRSLTNCRICRRIVMEHWPNANEKRCTNEYPAKSLKYNADLDMEKFGLSFHSYNKHIINRSKYMLNKHSLLLLHNALVLPHINYCCLIWGFTYPSYLNKIETLQKRVIGIIDQQHRLAHSDPIFKSLNILKAKDIAKQQLITVMHKKTHWRPPKGTRWAVYSFQYSYYNNQD